MAGNSASGGGGGGGSRKGVPKEKNESGTINRTARIPVTIPVPILSKRGYRPL